MRTMNLEGTAPSVPCSKEEWGSDGSLPSRRPGSWRAGRKQPYWFGGMPMPPPIRFIISCCIITAMLSYFL